MKKIMVGILLVSGLLYGGSCKIIQEEIASMSSKLSKDNAKSMIMYIKINGFIDLYLNECNYSKKVEDLARPFRQQEMIGYRILRDELN